MVVIASWNINSINAHLEQILSWLDHNDPDIVLLQETKCENNKFPYQYFEKYDIAHHGQKTYNGVAILSKFRLQDIESKFADNPCSEQSRFIQANINTALGLIKIINVYVPNGSEVGSNKFAIKIDFLTKLQLYIASLEQSIPTLIAGDFNVAPFCIDVYDAQAMYEQILFTKSEKALMRSILNTNFIDLYRLYYPDSEKFSWWDYRGSAFSNNHGCRIDFLLANPIMTNKLTSIDIDTQIRSYAGKNSDHAPVIAKFLKR